MVRGPLALFGAIVAVGLGPAMWLGTQFGQMSGTPSRPPAVTVQQDAGRGGVGGAAPDDPADLIKPTPKSNNEPLNPVVKPQPRKTSPAPSASPSASASPSKSQGEGGDSGDDHSTPPSDQTSTKPSTKPSAEPSASSSGGSGGGGITPPSPDAGTGSGSPNSVDAA